MTSRGRTRRCVRYSALRTRACSATRKSSARWLVIALISGYVSLALGDDPAPLPPLKKRAVALGYAGSIVGVDIPRNGDDRPNIGGLGVLGRVDLHRADRGWGLQLGYASKDGGTGSGGEISLDQAGLYAYYAWEGASGDSADSLRLRFYPKVGMSRTGFEETVPLTGTFSDAAFGPSFGLGVEWGAPRWGVVFDASWTFVDVELIPGQKESVNVSAGSLGLVYCS